MPPFYEGAHWFFPSTEEMIQNVMGDWRTPDSYPIDARGTAYTLAFFSAKHLGRIPVLPADGQRQGRQAAGRQGLLSSAGARERAGHAILVDDRLQPRHARLHPECPRVGRSSQTPGLKKNADGSADIYFGPAAPPSQESNWVPTDPNGRFEVLARFYGPQKPLFDKTWRLPDIERIAAQ